MLQKLHNAVRVEHVTAAQLGARLGAELACVADSAQFILIGAFKVPFGLRTGYVKAGQALALISDAFAGMTALFVDLVAERGGFCWLINVCHFICLLRHLSLRGARLLACQINFYF